MSISETNQSFGGIKKYVKSNDTRSNVVACTDLYAENLHLLTGTVTFNEKLLIGYAPNEFKNTEASTSGPLATIYRLQTSANLPDSATNALVIPQGAIFTGIYLDNNGESIKTLIGTTAYNGVSNPIPVRTAFGDNTVTIAGARDIGIGFMSSPTNTTWFGSSRPHISGIGIDYINTGVFASNIKEDNAYFALEANTYVGLVNNRLLLATTGFTITVTSTSLLTSTSAHGVVAGDVIGYSINNGSIAKYVVLSVTTTTITIDPTANNQNFRTTFDGSSSSGITLYKNASSTKNTAGQCRVMFRYFMKPTPS